MRRYAIHCFRLTPVIALIVSCLELRSQFQGSGYALEFDGSAYVMVQDTNKLDPDSAMTIEIWFRLDSFTPNTFQYLFQKWGGSGGNYGGWYCFITTDPWSSLPVIELRTKAPGSSITYIERSSATIDLERWYHLAISYDGDTTTIFLNGEVSASAAHSQGSIYANGWPMIIGSQYNLTNKFQGKMDEIRIWKKDLSASTVRQYMCKKLDAQHPNAFDLVLHYTMDVTSGSLVSDLSGNAINGNGSGISHVVSGAPIGNESAYAYHTNWSGKTLHLTHPNGDSLYLDSISLSWKEGLHIYRVDTFPNNDDAPAAVKGLLDKRYWGVFPSRPESGFCRLSYYYQGYPFQNKKADLNLNYRESNADSSWYSLLAENDTTNQVLVYRPGIQGEYILGSNDTLQTFNLLIPQDSSSAIIQGSAQSTLNFQWESTRIDTLATTYKWFIIRDNGNFSSPLLSSLSNSLGYDTLESTSFQSLANLMSLSGSGYGDSLWTKWSVEGSTGPLSKWARKAHKLLLIRGLLSSDSIYPFKLKEPKNYETITVYSGGPGVKTFSWDRANSTAGNKMFYSWKINGVIGSFGNPLLTRVSKNNGHDTSVTVSDQDLADMLKTQGVEEDRLYITWWISSASLQSTHYLYIRWLEWKPIGIENKQSVNFEIYPNPASDQISVRMENAANGISSLTIFDESGRIIRTFRGNGSSRMSIPISGVSNGNYILVIHAGKERFRKQISIE